jgi:hypothetical protein
MLHRRFSWQWFSRLWVSGSGDNCFLHFVHTYIPDCGIISQKTVILTQLFSCELFKTQWHCFHLQIRENSTHFAWPVSGDFCCITFSKKALLFHVGRFGMPYFSIYICVCVGKNHSHYFTYFVQMYHMDLYKDILLLMLPRYQPKFSYILQNWKTVQLSEKKSFLFHSSVLLWYN